MKTCKSSFFGLVLLVGTLGAVPASAQYATLPSGYGDGQHSAVDAQALRQLGCPKGLERFLPGIYYYCVGARDLQIGKSARGLDMLKIAAAWGSKPAQLTLGLAYFNGDVAAKDPVSGLAWLGLAAERGDPNYVAIFDSAWRKSTASQRLAADDLWRGMLPKYGDEHAAHRALRRYQHERDVLLDNEVDGARVCIEGLTTGKVQEIDPDNPDNTTCVGAMPVYIAAKQVDNFASSLLDGWQGHVVVGKLEQMPLPGEGSSADDRQK